MNSKIKRILVTGATGHIGYNICLAILESEFELIVIGRKNESNFRQKFSLPCKYFQWTNPAKSLPPVEAMDVDAVIHLMGEPLDGKKWTEKRKLEIRSSRINSTKNMVNAIESALGRIKVFVTASAIGIYGDRRDEILTEKSKIGDNFLANLCQEWEQEAKKSTCRNVQLRFGIVLSHDSGALKKMVPIFENSFGGPLSSGTQWMSWVHIDDVVGIVMKTLHDPKLIGPINIVSPTPVRNKEFTELLASALKVKAIFPVPKIALRLVLGEMAGVVLSSQKVLPEKLTVNNYTFKFTNLADAFNSIFDWKESCHDRLYDQQQWTPKPLNEVFDFFSDVKNLEELTPPLLNFKVEGKSTENIKEGTKIYYKLKIHGIPAKWTSLITNWQPMTEFADIQVKGPYAKWYHRHLFRTLAGGVLLEDKVVYRLPLSRYGGNLLNWFIRKDIKTIFSYRRKRIKEWQ